MTAQYDWLENLEFELEMDDPRMEILKLRKELVDLRKELEAVRKSSDAVRRGVFARLNEVSKLVMRLAGCDQA